MLSDIEVVPWLAASKLRPLALIAVHIVLIEDTRVPFIFLSSNHGPRFSYLRAIISLVVLLRSNPDVCVAEALPVLVVGYRPLSLWCKAPQLSLYLYSYHCLVMSGQLVMLSYPIVPPGVPRSIMGTHWVFLRVVS